MEAYPIKSVVLKGNLNTSNSTLSYNLINVHSAACKKNIWEICVKEVGYHNKSNATISQFAQIQCNLVHDLRLKDLQTQNYLPSIASVLIKATNQERKIVYFEKTWFEINTPNDEIRLTFKDVISEREILLNCDVFVTLLIRQKK
jgi:hypothetical protein